MAVEREGAVAVAAGARWFAPMKLDWPASTSLMVSAPLVVEVAGVSSLLGHVAASLPADHRRVVDAVDGDGDDLAGGAVGGDRGEAVGERLADAECWIAWLLLACRSRRRWRRA